MISSITVENPFYLSPIRGSYVKLDTDAGNVRQADLSFVMKRKDVERLVKYAQEKLVGDAKTWDASIAPRLWYIAILSLISSNSLTGVLFASTLISQSGNLLGKEFEDMLVTNLTKIAELLAFEPTCGSYFSISFIGWMGDWLFAQYYPQQRFFSQPSKSEYDNPCGYSNPKILLF